MKTITILVAIMSVISVYRFVYDFKNKRSKFRNKKNDEEQERRFDYLMLMLSGVRNDNDMEIFAGEVKMKLQEADYSSERYKSLFRHYTEVNELLKRIRVNDGNYILSKIDFGHS